MLPQNMLIWTTDYFELKALEKKQVQEGYSYLPFFSLKADENTPCEKCPLFSRRKETFLSPGMGVKGEREVSTNRPYKITLIFL